ncbi:hypothetical protein [Neptunomonas qingdaonensis]|uniref:HD domain-containing protein n=1 Tax=Neptunomonas qingdaonensis TaxID=1045558 RepID=A0A1I2TVH1_9GAMM|nr:hypothetical protein [Neptunomonas qingdaonensis]SFG66301.1 uncharacterized protein SAMN05216175_110143 [Neptunomonas qingdaonensis]
MTIQKDLMQAIISSFKLDLDGLHGINHWARVYINGKIITDLHGINGEVVELFSIFHDSMRLSESIDKCHGYRGAEFAKSLRGKYFELSDRDFDLLYKACKFHTYPIKIDNIVIQSCWDADRLDLGRYGLPLNKNFIAPSTVENLKIINEAYTNGLNHYEPPITKIWSRRKATQKTSAFY